MKEYLIILDPAFLFWVTMLVLAIAILHYCIKVPRHTGGYQPKPLAKGCVSKPPTGGTGLRQPTMDPAGHKNQPKGPRPEGPPPAQGMGTIPDTLARLADKVKPPAKIMNCKLEIMDGLPPDKVIIKSAGKAYCFNLAGELLAEEWEDSHDE